MALVRAPQPLGMRPSFGFGDRVGLATPGHIDALRAYGGPIQPVFAQQSLRELTRTGRRPGDVLRDTVAALERNSFGGVWSADADHLKSQEDINAAASAGFVYFTLSVSDLVDPRADDYSPSEIEKRFKDLHDDVHWADCYHGQPVTFDGGSLTLERAAGRRAAVKFGRALAHAVKLAAHAERVMAKRREPHEIELCLDDTAAPATPAEHYILVDQCRQSNVRPTCVALRWANGWEPGIDFPGDAVQFAADIAVHAAIARHLGPYKLALHCGSDKFALYEALARATGGLLHVKTAGTSYLESLRVAARKERKLFRRIVDFSRERFQRDRATYRVSARPELVPHAAAVADDAALERLYLDAPHGRQILHVTFGSVLTDHVLGPCLRDVLVAHPDLHRELIAKHLGRHLQALARGLETAERRFDAGHGPATNHTAVAPARASGK